MARLAPLAAWRGVKTMVGWSGRRKALTILLFTFPTIIGLLIFNIYPLLLNTYTSFTNNNKFHPYPNCSAGLNNIIEPYCWSYFQNAPTGAGIPFKIVEPIFANYQAILGGLFTLPGVLSILTIVLCLVPIYGSYKVDQRMQRGLERRFPAWVIWLAGIIISLVLLYLFGANAWSRLIDSGDFMSVVARTILFVILRVPITFVIGLVMALIVSSPGLPGKTFWRVVLFIPWAASSVAILTSLVWQFFFRENGTINQVLSLFNIQGPVWLNDPLYAFGIIILVDVWYSYPFFMIAILGAISAISNDVYEAADIDGASYWQQLRNITLPLIRPALLPAIVLTSITAFQMFGTVWAITQGGPTKGAGVPGSTEFVMVYAYKQIFQLNNYGTATAFATIIFIFLFAATLYSLRVTQLTKGATA
jgi:arabinogalactan oligomer/maltooligosaccharide transport system permease protein